MIKISRRGYTQHVRMLCITTERVYNLTKRDSYPKESLLYAEILGITCTPYKDGFMCIHTKETHEDRVNTKFEGTVTSLFASRVIGWLLLIIRVSLSRNYLWLWDEMIITIVF